MSYPHCGHEGPHKSKMGGIVCGKCGVVIGYQVGKKTVLLK